jgi:uncharacterized SAM-dependent methyltransferase
MELALRPVWVDASLRDDAIARKRAASLFNGAVDHLFHYRGERQAQLWLAVHRAHAPLFADDAYAAIFASLYETLISQISGPGVHVVALGPGAGSKESLLLQALGGAGIAVRYTPIDASLELACLSADAAPASVETVDPVAGDLSLLASIGPWLDDRSGDRPRIVTAFGISPNFAPSELFARCRGVLRPGDRLLLSANLAGTSEEDGAYARACEAILPQYDNEPTKRWLRQILHDWDLSAALSEPSFTIESIDGVRGFIAASRWLRDVAFDWEGRAFSAAAGDRLRLFFSLRYTPARLSHALEGNGLARGAGFVTPDGREGVWIVSPA